MKKRTKDKENAPTSDIHTIVLPKELIDTILQIAEKRKTDMATVVKLAMMNLTRCSGQYDLNTKMRFGKYADATLEGVIRCDPGYVHWAIRTLDNFNLSAEATELLEQVEHELA